MSRLNLCHLLMAMLIVVAGCAGGQQDAIQSSLGPAGRAAPLEAPQAGEAGSGQLPLPSAIERDASEIPDYQRIKPGSDNHWLLPVANFSSGSFFPSWTSPADGLSKAAFACYGFNFAEPYTDDARVRMDWSVAPQDFGNLYVAFANFELDRWEWHPCPQEGVNLGSPERYLAPSGSLYLCVLLLGTEPAIISSIVLGSNVAPQGYLFTDLDLDPTKNIGPREVSINASVASAPVSEIAGWDFDFEGDGTWDVLGDTDGLEVHLYQPGHYTLTVRISDVTGKQGLLTEEFTIVNPSNQAPLAVLSASTLSGSAPLSLDVDALLSSDADGTITKYEYDFDNDGEFDITKDDPGPVGIMLSAYNINTVVLRVTDNDFATATATVDITLDSGWLYSVVDNDATVFDGLAMAVTGNGAGARACVAYVESDGSQLRYSNGANSAHNSWSGVRLPLGMSDAVGEFPGISIAYNHIDDYPMISYTDWDGSFEDKLRVVRGNDTYGNSWKAPVQVDGSVGFGMATDIEMVNNIPVVAAVSHFMDQGLSEIRYYQATSSTGGSWSAPRVVMPVEENTFYRDVSISTYENGLFDRPLIAFSSDYSPPYEIRSGIVRSSNVDGTVWEAASYLGVQFCYEIELARINGNPAVVAGSSTSGASMYYARSADDTATGWPVEMEPVGKGGSLSLATWGGRPCAVSRPFSGELFLVRGADADGSSWEEPIPVDRRGLGGDLCAMVVVNGIPVVCYSDNENKRLLAASWKSN